MSTLWVQTYTGKAVDLLDPQPDQICFADIAHALAGLPRYTNQIPTPVSVACHSRYVARLLLSDGEDKNTAWIGLMHDAPEAYIGDCTAPLKRAMRQIAGGPSPFDEIEARFWAVLCEKYGLPAELPDVVVRADIRACAAEKRDLGFNESPRDWGLPYYGPRQVSDPMPFGRQSAHAFWDLAQILAPDPELLR